MSDTEVPAAKPMDSDGEAGGASSSATHTSLDSLSDRLREVRRQLMRGRQLAGAFEGERVSPAALRAAERLEAAVRWLDDSAPPPRTMRGLNDSAELPWLVRVVELRAAVLERALRQLS